MSNGSGPLLSAQGVSKRFGGLLAISQVDLQVPLHAHPEVYP